MERVLVVDDESGMRSLLEKILSKEGYEVDVCGHAMDALNTVREGGIDLVISDLKMPDMTGLELLQNLQEEFKELPVIIITAFGTIQTAIDAMKIGAFDYITKPFNNTEIKLVVRKALNQVRLIEEKRYLLNELEGRFHPENIIGKSKPIEHIFSMMKQVADTRTTVLITGESGTGKELIAKALHYNSSRRERRFVAINCGALPDQLLESELFGHEKGSFTDAIKAKKGLFEEAHGGTILLDEIGDTSLVMQVKLLRALQENEIRRVGGNRDIKVDVRVVASTNKNLEEAIREKAFREDLFYRLNVISLHVPPLRERPDDIPLLVEHFLAKYSKEIKKGVKGVTPEAMDLLQRHFWPGNIRELQNIIERIVTLTSSETIGVGDLPSEFSGKQVTYYAPISPKTYDQLRAAKKNLVGDLEKKFLVTNLEESGGNVTRAAREAGIDRGYFLQIMRKHGLSAEDYRSS